MLNLADIIMRQDKEALKKVAFVSIHDNALVFDRKKQLSRARMVG